MYHIGRLCICPLHCLRHDHPKGKAEHKGTAARTIPGPVKCRYIWQHLTPPGLESGLPFFCFLLERVWDCEIKRRTVLCAYRHLVILSFCIPLKCSKQRSSKGCEARDSFICITAAKKRKGGKLKGKRVAVCRRRPRPGKEVSSSYPADALSSDTLHPSSHPSRKISHRERIPAVPLLPLSRPIPKIPKNRELPAALLNFRRPPINPVPLTPNRNIQLNRIHSPRPIQERMISHTTRIRTFSRL